MGAFSALVLAASRQDVPDPIAEQEGVPAKYMADIAGRPMLEHVVNALWDSGAVRTITIATDRPDLMTELPGLMDGANGRYVSLVPAAPSLTESVVQTVRGMDNPYPLLISTADNGLHTPEMISDFANASLAAPADVTIGMTAAATLLAAYPDGKRAFHRLRDGGWSSANMYALLNPSGLDAAQIFQTGGQFGKRPLRLLRAFGGIFFLHYLSRRATLDQLMDRAGRRFGLTIRAVRLNYAEAPIDVDSLADLNLTRLIWERRCNRQ